MSDTALIKTASSSQQRQFLLETLKQAQQELLEAEAELATEQAAVNAFRMQCRLKIGSLIDDYLELRAEKQALWTHLQLLHQAQEFGIPYDEDDPFWHGRDEENLHDDLPEDGEMPELSGLIRDRAAEKRLYRELARRFHPDLAVNGVERAYMTAMMSSVNVAYESHDVNTLRDLANELDPTAVTELAQIDTAEIRKLHEKILKVQRRKRRAWQQLKSLRQENTARLWRKAEALKQDGRAWWHEVRHDLNQLITRRQTEIVDLQKEVAHLEETMAVPST